MATTFSSLLALLDHGYDTVIDVRSPAEYAQDHVPGAINLPALSDAERAKVGTLYVQVAPFTARKTGAALVARNVAAHLDGPLAGFDGSWRPLLYCWRGGQRSGSFTSILTQIGWRADLLEGGYQSFRRLVHDALYDTEIPYDLILLGGYTGTAKTDLLHLLATSGVQVLDLEGMAGHRGSLLGTMPGGQPSQRAFESAIACALARFDPAHPVIIEAESSKIGDRIIPPMLWAAMKDAPRIEVDAPLPARAAYLVEAYADIIADTAELSRRLEILRRFRGAETVARWQAMLDAGDHTGLATALMADHYDPTYAASRGKQDPQILQRFEAGDLGAKGRAALVAEIAAWLAAR